MKSNSNKYLWSGLAGAMAAVSAISTGIAGIAVLGVWIASSLGGFVGGGLTAGALWGAGAAIVGGLALAAAGAYSAVSMIRKMSAEKQFKPASAVVGFAMTATALTGAGYGFIESRQQQPSAPPATPPSSVEQFNSACDKASQKYKAAGSDLMPCRPVKRIP